MAIVIDETAAVSALDKLVFPMPEKLLHRNRTGSVCAFQNFFLTTSCSITYQALS